MIDIDEPIILPEISVRAVLNEVNAKARGYRVTTRWWVRPAEWIVNRLLNLIANHGARIRGRIEVKP